MNWNQLDFSMKDYVYLGKPQINISDVLSMDKKLRESATFKKREGAYTFDFNAKHFTNFDLDQFEETTHYSVKGYFSPTVDSFDKLIHVCKTIRTLYPHFGLGGEIWYNGKELKSSKKDNKSEISILVGDGNGIVYFSFQKNSPYIMYKDGVLIKDSKLQELYSFMEELTKKTFTVNNSNRFVMPVSDLTHSLVEAAHNYLGERIISVFWSVGVYADAKRTRKDLDIIVNEKLNADRYEAALTTKIKSFMAFEELRKIIDHKTNMIIPFGAWFFSENKKNPEGFMPSFRIMEKGYQFLVVSPQPLHEGSKITPEMQNYLDSMGVDMTKATSSKKILEEVHPE